MDLGRLEVFVAVAETGSMTAAARKVHLTQPAVSRNIKQLEEDLGVALFDRRGRGLALTQAGRALVSRASALLDQSRQLERHARRAAERSYFDVRIGTVDSVATYLFPQVIRPLREAFAELEVKFYTGRTVSLLKRVEAGELDMVIVAWSGEPDFDQVERIGRYDLQFYAHKDAFPEIEGVEDEEEVLTCPLVQLEPLPGQPTLISEEMATFALAGSLATVKSMVLGGFGVGSLLHFMLTSKERAQLVRANVPHDPDCALFVVVSDDWRGEGEDEIRRVLVDALREAFPAVD